MHTKHRHDSSTTLLILDITGLDKTRTWIIKARSSRHEWETVNANDIQCVSFSQFAPAANCRTEMTDRSIRSTDSRRQCRRWTKEKWCSESFCVMSVWRSLYTRGFYRLRMLRTRRKEAWRRWETYVHALSEATAPREQRGRRNIPKALVHTKSPLENMSLEYDFSNNTKRHKNCVRMREYFAVCRSKRSFRTFEQNGWNTFDGVVWTFDRDVCTIRRVSTCNGARVWVFEKVC